MEEKKNYRNSQPQKAENEAVVMDPEECMKMRLNNCINAIEYLKKYNLSQDQKQIFAILDKAEEIKSLQKRNK